MTAVLVPEHSVAGIKEEDKKPGSSALKKTTKSVGIIRIGAHSKKIIDTSNGKVTVLDTPVNQFLKENPSGNCTCAASGLEPEEYFDRLKQKSSCCSKEEKPASNGCCSGNKVKKEEESLPSRMHGNGGHVASSHVGNNSHVNSSSPMNPSPAAAHINHSQNSTQALPGVNTIYQGPGVIQGQGQTQGQVNGYHYNSYYQQPSYMYNSAYYAGHTVQVQSEGHGMNGVNGHGHGIQLGLPGQSLPGQSLPGQSLPGQSIPQGVQGQSMAQGVPQGQNVQVMTQAQTMPQVQTQVQTPNQEVQIQMSQTNANSPMLGQIDPSFSQMWKGETPQEPAQPHVSADSGPEDRLTPEEFFDMYFAPTCSIPGQCGCGDGCQCKGCPTHDSQTELEGVSSGERFTWE
jgi:hypothetical protein